MFKCSPIPCAERRFKRPGFSAIWHGLGLNKMLYNLTACLFINSLKVFIQAKVCQLCFSPDFLLIVKPSEKVEASSGD